MKSLRRAWDVAIEPDCLRSSGSSEPWRHCAPAPRKPGPVRHPAKARRVSSTRAPKPVARRLGPCRSMILTVDLRSGELIRMSVGDHLLMGFTGSVHLYSTAEDRDGQLELSIWRMRPPAVAAKPGGRRRSARVRFCSATLPLSVPLRAPLRHCHRLGAHRSGRGSGGKLVRRVRAPGSPNWASARAMAAWVIWAATPEGTLPRITTRTTASPVVDCFSIGSETRPFG